MQVINAKTGKPEELDPIKITEGLASGTHLPPPGQGVLLNPNSELVFVPAEDVQENVYKYGYRVPQPDELRKIGRDFTYGTDSAMLQAGLAGAARGGTFGISDFLAVKTGLTSPEHLSALKEYYPTTSTLGEIGGAVGTAFIPGSLVGQVVKGAKAAEAFAVGKAAAALPAKAAANVIAKTAIETGGKALGGAIEGMAFGLGQSVSEAALGDPDLNAEKIMANVGYGGLMGGGLGAVFNVGRIGAKKALEGAKKAYGKAYDFLIGKTVARAPSETPPSAFESVGTEAGEVGGTVAGAADETGQAAETVFEPGWATQKAAKLASVTSGVPEQEILANLQAKMDPTKVVLTTAEKDALVTQFSQNIDDIYKNLDKLTKKVSGKYRPQETAKLLEDAELYGPLRQLQSFQDDLSNAIKRIEAEPSLYSANKKAKFGKILEEMERKPIESYKTAAEVFEELDKRKGQLQKLQKWKKRLEGIANEVEVDTITDIISPMVDKLKSGLEMPEIWGEAGARQAAYNNKISSFIASKEGLEQFLMRQIKLGKGRPVMEIDPVKTNTFFNQINDNRAKFRNRAVMDFLKAGREVIDEIEKTAGNVPGQPLDVTGVRQFVEKTSEQALKAKDVVSDAFGGYGFFRDLMDAAKSGGVGGLASQIGTAFTSPDTLVNVLKGMEWLTRQVDQKSRATSKFIFEKVKPPTRGAGIIIQESTTQRTDRYKKAIDKLKTLTDVPDAMLDDLDAATRETFEYAPRISQGLQMAAVRATTFLQSKVPQPPDKGILDTPYEPSQAQIITFMRYHDAVDNPMIALKQLEDNYVPRETLETLKTVYPSLYNDMKESLIGEMSDKMAAGTLTLPYQRRVVLSQFLEMPLDSSFRPEIIARNQEQLAVIGQKAEAKEAAQQAVRPTQTGLGKVSLANRSETGLEKVVARA